MVRWLENTLRKDGSLSSWLCGMAVFAFFAASMYGLIFNFLSFNDHVQRSVVIAAVLTLGLYAPLLYRLVAVLHRSASTVVGASMIILFLGFGLCFVTANIGAPAVLARLFGEHSERSFTVDSKSSGKPIRGCDHYIAYHGNGVTAAHHCVDIRTWNAATAGGTVTASVWLTTEGILVGRSVRPED